MGYLDKNINMALIIVIVITVVVLLGITIFFQTGLQTRTSDYETTNEELTVCTSQLSTCQTQLSEQESLVNSTAEDIRRYDTLYTQRTAELDQLEQQRQTLQNQLTVAQQARDLAVAESQQRQQTIIDLESEVDDLERLVRDLRADLRDCRDDPANC